VARAGIAYCIYKINDIYCPIIHLKNPFLMKKFVVLLAAGLCLLGTSCKKCYKCTTTVTYSDNQGMNIPSATSNSEVCGTKKDKKEKESNGTASSTVSMMGVTMTANSVTSCN
jgi:hypothetical protein